MKSLKELYKIGKGPSSSHTIGPQIIAEYVIKNFGHQKYKVELFGSFAMTGKGHGTDRVLREILGEVTEIDFNTEKIVPHPNTLKIYNFIDNKENELISAQSIGGGNVVINGQELSQFKNIYKEKNFTEIKDFILKNNLSLVKYVEFYEKDIFEKIKIIWQVMKESVERGLNKSGVLNGGLKLERKAKGYIMKNRNLKHLLYVNAENFPHML
jgi:L-serine dehydratase